MQYSSYIGLHEVGANGISTNVLLSVRTLPNYSTASIITYSRVDETSLDLGALTHLVSLQDVMNIRPLYIIRPYFDDVKGNTTSIRGTPSHGNENYSVSVGV